MKRKFALLVLDDGTGNGAIPNENIDRLRSLCEEHGVACNPQVVSAGSIVFVAGNPQPEQLERVCNELLAAGHDIQLVDDALTNRNQLTEVLFRLNDRTVPLTRVALVSQLVGAEHQIATVQSATVSTATVAVVIGAKYWWQRAIVRSCYKCYAKAKMSKLDRLFLALFDRAKVLTIRRGNDPFKGSLALPGGRHAASLETLRECAVRELSEECHIKLEPSWLHLVDERSSPWRDPRGHLIDHGYVWHVPSDAIAEVERSVEAGDDAQPDSAIFRSLARVLASEIAFDHDAILRRIVGLY